MINKAINEKIKTGATVRVYEKVQEKGKERLRRFEGLVLARKHGNEPGATFTVRSIISGIGVEKVFPLHSPNIDKVEIISSPKNVNKSKLYYVRNISRKMLRKKTAIKEDIAKVVAPEPEPTPEPEQAKKEGSEKEESTKKEE